MADTLTGFADAVLNDRKQAITDAQTTLKNATAAAKQAADQVDAATTAMQEQSDKRAETGRKIAALPPAPELKALADELTTQEAELNKRRARLAEAQKDAALKKAVNARAGDAVSRAQKSASDAERAKKRADEDAKTWKSVADAVTRVHDLDPSDAADKLKKSDLYKDAKARVFKELPNPLRDAALGRTKELRKKGTDAADAAEAEVAKLVAHYDKPHGGEQGAVALARIALDDKAAAMRGAANAKLALERIERTLKDILGAPPLSAQVQAGIDPAKPESVPEEAWRRLDAFDTASAELDALKQLDKAAIEKIQDDYQKAEKALVEKLDAESKAADDFDEIQWAVAAKREEAAVIAEFAQAHVVAALRDDK